MLKLFACWKAIRPVLGPFGPRALKGQPGRCASLVEERMECFYENAHSHIINAMDSLREESEIIPSEGGK